jgi:hypothetical protein
MAETEQPPPLVLAKDLPYYFRTGCIPSGVDEGNIGFLPAGNALS